MMIKEIARQAALDKAADLMGGADWVDRADVIQVADAVAVAVLREVERFGSIAAGSAARTLLAEFTPAPVVEPSVVEPWHCAQCGARNYPDGKPACWKCSAPVTPEPLAALHCLRHCEGEYATPGPDHRTDCSRFQPVPPEHICACGTTLVCPDIGCDRNKG